MSSFVNTEEGLRGCFLTSCGQGIKNEGSFRYGPDRTLVFWVNIQSNAFLKLGLNNNKQALAQIVALFEQPRKILQRELSHTVG